LKQVPALSFDNIGSLILVAGVSGAGKSIAVDALSDLGFYTIENLPVPLLPSFLDLTAKAPERFVQTALCLDIDSRDKQEQLLAMLKSSGQPSGKVQLIFLDCKSEVIVKRYGQTRRPHPGFDSQKDKTLEDAIVREKKRLFALREIADLVIDTSELTVHDLAREIKAFVEKRSPQAALRTIRMNFLSFGFKHGLPIDCDLVMDVRFLLNPYFVESLQKKSGLDAEVVDYIMQTPAANEFLSRYLDLIESLLPQYVFSGKTYLNVGIGCTGGRHRSVAIAEQLAQKMRLRLPEDRYLVSVKHRDLEKGT
jgi:RNase adapter protein RapZ